MTKKTNDYIPLKWRKAGYADSKHRPGKEMYRGGGKTTSALKELMSDAESAQEPKTYFFLTLTHLMATEAMRLLQKKEGKDAVTAHRVHGPVIIVEKTASVIHFISADNPDYARGIRFDGGVVDEAQDINPKIWQEILGPANNGECRLYGTEL